MITKLRRLYLAGFLDGDGSIYVRLKPNETYKYGFQVEPYIVLFQSAQNKKNFEKLCSIIPFGKMRERKDGILEFTINKIADIREFLKLIGPFVILKRAQVDLMIRILDKKSAVESKNDFLRLMSLIDEFRNLNYSKKRKYRTLTP